MATPKAVEVLLDWNGAAEASRSICTIDKKQMSFQFIFHDSAVAECEIQVSNNGTDWVKHTDQGTGGSGTGGGHTITGSVSVHMNEVWAFVRVAIVSYTSGYVSCYALFR